VNSGQWAVEFVKSCAALGDLPDDRVSEVALMGRSNVGKSSLLNSLAGRRHLAHTSRTPGRTRLLNLFQVTPGAFRLVDCPGYGYAQAARELRAQWGELIGQYLENRPNLRRVALLVDSRLEPQALDLQANDWLRHRGVPVQLVATKWDRLSGNQRTQAKKRLSAAFGAMPLGYSSVTHEGRDELRQALARA